MRGGGKKSTLKKRKKALASEPFACNLQAYEKTNSPTPRVHTPETNEVGVHHSAPARTVDPSRDDPAARRRVEPRHPQVVGGESCGRADVQAALRSDAT